MSTAVQTDSEFEVRIAHLIAYHLVQSETYQTRAMQCDHPITAAFLDGQAKQHGQWVKDIEFLKGFLRGGPKEVTPGR